MMLNRHWHFIPLLLLCFSATAQAGTFNYRAVLIGERAVGMGGAYTALSNTTEGSFYNPAGLAFIDESTLSVAGNIYVMARGRRKNALTFAGDTADLTQDAFNSIPQIASFAHRVTMPWDPDDAEVSPSALGFTIALVEQIDLFGRVDFNVPGGQAFLTRSTHDRTLFVGPTYSRKFNDRFSLGVSIFYAVRFLEAEAFILQDAATILAQGFLQEKQIIGNMAALIGARFSPAPNFWIGLSYMPPSIRLHSGGSRLLSTIVHEKTPNKVSSSIVDDPNQKPQDPLPQKISVGLAYAQPHHWAIAGDALIYLGDDFAPLKGVAGSVHRNTIVNFSVGGEWYFLEKVPLRAGVYSNFSSADDIQPGVAGQADKVDQVGFTFSGSLEQKNTTLTLGTVIALGKGEGLDNLMNKIDVTANNYGFFLAGSYKF